MSEMLIKTPHRQRTNKPHTETEASPFTIRFIGEKSTKTRRLQPKDGSAGKILSTTTKYNGRLRISAQPTTDSDIERFAIVDLPPGTEFVVSAVNLQTRSRRRTRV